MKARNEIENAFRAKYEALKPSFPQIGPFESHRMSRLGEIRVCDLGEGGRAAFVMDGDGNLVEVHGGIYDVWKGKGGSNGSLGLPVTDESDYHDPDARPGDRFSRFENGVIVWRADTWETEVRPADRTSFKQPVAPDNNKMKSGEMNLLVDCGGSGVKIRRYVKGILQPDTHRFAPKSFEEFCKCLGDMARDGNPSAHPHVTGIAIAICGAYDYVTEAVLNCWAYPFLIGRLKDKLKERFKCENVRVVNDGDAHVLALRSVRKQKGMSSNSAINLALGTAVGFGILDWKGNLLHTCRGHNWEVGNWQCDTSARNKAQYWALGSQGLRALEEKHGSPNAYIYYGERLCHFLGRDLVPVFHPRIIGISGGILAAHFDDIKEEIRRECETRRYCARGGSLDGIEIYLSPEKDSVMKGLADLLDQDGRPENDPRCCTDLAKSFAEDRPCSLLAVHAGQVVCAENGGNAPLVANRQTVQGNWETFVPIKNDDGSFSLKSAVNDKYVSAMPDGRLFAQGNSVDLWERFDLKEVPGKDGVFTLWSLHTQKYVSVDETEGNVLIANRDVPDAWEEFRILWGTEARDTGAQPQIPANSATKPESVPPTFRDAVEKGLNLLPAETLEEKVKQIVVDSLRIEESQVVPAASFVNDLRADDFDLAELMMNIEDSFGRKFFDTNGSFFPYECVRYFEEQKIETVEDLVDHLRSKGVPEYFAKRQ